MKVELPLAVGHIPSGLFIICTKEGDQKDGYLASWVQQVSFNPLLVSFTIKPDRVGYQSIIDGKTFTINVVGDHETQYMRHFWSSYGPENNPFHEIDHEVSENDGVLIKDAKSVIECKFVSKTTPGDHEIITAEVIGSYIFNEESKPKVHIRKSGLDY